MISNAGSAAVILARRALMISAAIAHCGALVGVTAVMAGSTGVAESALIFSCVLFSGVVFGLLAFQARVPVQWLATASTMYYTVYLCSGTAISMYDATSEPLHLLVYLVWFCPLLIVNRLVNSPAVARFMNRLLRIVPILLVLALTPCMIARFGDEAVPLAVVWGLSHTLFGFAFEVVTRYRERFLVERAHAASLHELVRTNRALRASRRSVQRQRAGRRASFWPISATRSERR